MMKKVLIPLYLFLPILLFAQNEDTTTVELDEIIIAENRIQLPYAAQSRSISIIDRKSISETPAISITDVLHHVGGIDVRTRGVHGVQADIGIRGGTFDQTLVLINGIKLSDPQTGHHSMNLPVNLGAIERIEVLKGPAARTFGQNAFAGAVNIVTAEPDKSFLNIGGIVGDFNLWGINTSGAIVRDKQSHFASFSYDHSDGYKHNTDYNMLNAFYNGIIKLRKGEINILGGYTDRAFGANGFYASPDYTEQFESIRTGLAALSYNTLIGKSSLEARAYYRQNDDEYIFIRDNPEFYKNNHSSRTYGVEVNSVIPWEKSITGIGIDINNVELNSNNLGNRQRLVSTFYLEHRMEIFNDKFNVTPGVQINNYSDYGLNVLPGVDLGYILSERLTAFGSVGYTYRVPTFTDIYYTGPVNVGNPDLKPEYAMNYEIGLKTKSALPVSLHTSLFYRSGKDMIDWQRLSESDPWQPVNLLFVEMQGLEINTSFDFKQLIASNSLLDNLNVSYAYINSEADNQTNTLSRYALENLRHQLRGTLLLNYGSKLTHTISAGYYDRVNLDDYMLLDTRVTYKHGRLNMFADVTNVFNVSYQETNLVAMPGRWFKVGVNVEVF